MLGSRKVIERQSGDIAKPRNLLIDGKDTLQGQLVGRLLDEGILLPFNDVESYHGRAEQLGGEAFAVKPDFSGRNHPASVFRSPFYAANGEVAMDFALKRAQYLQAATGRLSYPGVYSIKSYSDSSNILRATRSDDIDRRVRRHHMEEIAEIGRLAVIDTLTPSYEFRDADLSPVLDKLDRPVRRKGADPANVEWIGNLRNSRIPAEIANFAINITLARDYYCRNFSMIGHDRVSADQATFSELGFMYADNLSRQLNTLGFVGLVSSATLGRGVMIHTLIDKYQIGTKKQVENRRAAIEEEMNPLLHLVKEELFKKSSSEPILYKLAEPYVTPRDLIETAMATSENCRQVFAADSGVREGFSLQQHTETALGVFEENYADKLPKGLLPLARLIILVHDIGKPESVVMNDKIHQGIYNVEIAELFMRQWGIAAPVRRLVEFSIDEAAKLAHSGYIEDNEVARRELYDRCFYALINSGLTDRVTKEQAKGLETLCLILQTCDSAAYTKLSLTRKPGSDMYYRNGNDRFLESFEMPVDSRGRLALLKSVKEYSDSAVLNW